MRAATWVPRGLGWAGRQGPGWLREGPRRGHGGATRRRRVGGYVPRPAALYGRKKGHRMGGLCASGWGLGGAALWFGGHAGQAGGRHVEVVLVLFYPDELVPQLQSRHAGGP